MKFNPYTEIFLQDSESVMYADQLHYRNKSINDLYEKSNRVAITFMICHVRLGLSNAIRILNETLNGVMEDNNRERIIVNNNTINSKTIEVLSFLMMMKKEQEVCRELIDELSHGKLSDQFIENLKPKFL